MLANGGDEFETLWARLQGCLHAGTKVPYWGVRRGYSGRAFQVTCVDERSIAITGSGLSIQRTISRKELQRIHARWRGYCDGSIQRQTLRPLSFNTSFILSILRWLEECC